MITERTKLMMITMIINDKIDDRNNNDISNKIITIATIKLVMIIIKE